jgi:hypothetical protein
LDDAGFWQSGEEGGGLALQVVWRDGVKIVWKPRKWRNIINNSPIFAVRRPYNGMAVPQQMDISWWKKPPAESGCGGYGIAIARCPQGQDAGGELVCHSWRAAAMIELIKPALWRFEHVSSCRLMCGRT